MKKLSLLLTVVGMVLLSACGSAEPAAQTGGSPAQVTGEPASSTTAGNALERIKKSGKIVIGTSGTFKPGTFVNEKGELDGYEIDWGNLIAERLGVKAEFVAGSLNGLVPGLVAGKFDLVMSGLIITEERKKSIDFSERYKVDGGIAVVRADNTTVTDVRNLDGLIVGVIGGSGYVEDVNEIGGFKEMKEYPGSPEAFIDLKAGRIDVYVAAKGGVVDFLDSDKSANPLKMVGETYNTKDSGVGINKNEPELKQVIDALIAEKKKDGTYDELSLKWFGFTMPQ